MKNFGIPVLYLVLASVLVLLILAACGGSTTPSTGAATPPPADSVGSSPSLDGASLMQERCSVCHSVDKISSANKTADQWKTTVERMQGKGAQLDTTEQQALINYLAQTYP